MDKRIWKLFVRTWLFPFIAALMVIAILFSINEFYRNWDNIANKHVPVLVLCKLFLLTGSYYAIHLINAATFFASSLAGWRLARYWNKLPVKLFPLFLPLIMVLCGIAFLLFSVVKPNVLIRQQLLLYNISNKPPDGPLHLTNLAELPDDAPTTNPFILHKRNITLYKQIATAKQHLIQYICSSRTKQEAYTVYMLKEVWAAGITEEEIAQYSGNTITPSANINDTDAIPAMIKPIREMQAAVASNTTEQWTNSLQPLKMLLYYMIAFYIGALNHRQGIWEIVIIMICFTAFAYRLDRIAFKRKSTEDIPLWFSYIFPLIMQLAAGIVSYLIYKSTYKKAVKTPNRAIA